MATRCMLRGRGQEGTQFKPGTRPWRRYSRGAPRRWLFKYVLTVIITCSFSCNVMCSCNMLAIPYVQGNWFIILIGVYFLQVKNKPWLRWVYTWIWHHHGQYLSCSKSSTNWAKKYGCTKMDIISKNYCTKLFVLDLPNLIPKLAACIKQILKNTSYLQITIFSWSCKNFLPWIFSRNLKKFTVLNHSCKAYNI